ncbi:matrix metalloproteinase [Alphaentomopoxvirus acuprea]|uniref:Matrix metalloproteinase n=1 Tax=Alphaentomopoxvirus acuprea TaxID=62099 RepID=W6JKS0_9POXV|nr:matrix metalloproteinase [Anomala cuprea entomopoxvirus]YP_009001727.1 matrix metalloproteinase [Anomala cuprea entomopoxvirus]BAO49370.1 matrix metalloproteinase [Anomala cuprea entomopoxvirus]BAO49614.1 matrix metalloproteinase [Anomala cuprea entomopoxvirus]
MKIIILLSSFINCINILLVIFLIYDDTNYSIDSMYGYNNIYFNNRYYNTHHLDFTYNVRFPSQRFRCISIDSKIYKYRLTFTFISFDHLNLFENNIILYKNNLIKITQNAFNAWTKYTNLDISYTNDHRADIVIFKYYVNTVGDLGQATFPAQQYPSYIRIYQPNCCRTLNQFKVTILHEIGHALGFHHITTIKSVMFPKYNPYIQPTIEEYDTYCMMALYNY